MKRNSLLSPPTSPTSNNKFSYIDAVTEEARYRMQLEDEFLNFDYSQHQMVEEDSGLLSHFLEQRRNSLKRQYDRFKRRSTSSFLDITSSSSSGPIHLPTAGDN